ncbi:AFG1-like ATPase-domain-containing protein [Scheffersomyces coipomensis]|uniref:AFG1-like ATPase-domain-containing protein n=1 Tax=Scheffersomyces coipomensis TaxID=1788519 RepID=UPI00315DC1C4
MLRLSLLSSTLKTNGIPLIRSFHHSIIYNQEAIIQQSQQQSQPIQIQAPSRTSASPANYKTPLEEYNHKIEQGKLRDDPYQRKIISNLSILHSKLLNYTPPELTQPNIQDLKPRFFEIKSFFTSFLSSKDKSQQDRELQESLSLNVEENEIKGIYLYGDVGCGKTMLMDLFYNTIPKHLPKKRIHFHQFMQHLHKRSHQLKQQYSNQNSTTTLGDVHNDIDVIPILANEIANDSTILCFDEFQVTDVADAMLLRRLLMLLLNPQHGVILFATSNRAPDDLYLNGIQRVSFIPCIQLIKLQTRIIYLNSPIDYRKIPKPLSSNYYHPKPGVKYLSAVNQTNCKKHVETWYNYFNNHEEDQPNDMTSLDLKVWGRTLTVPICSPPNVAQFTFDELCGNKLAAGDYLTLAQSFKSFIVTDIPYLSVNVRDEVRRFITFLDAVYDNHGNLAVTSVAPFKDLFVEPEDLKEGNFQLYMKKSKDQSLTKGDDSFANDELVLKHGFDKSIARKASMFVNDEEKFAFARALSRLSQMSTTEWIEAERD